MLHQRDFLGALLQFLFPVTALPRVLDGERRRVVVEARRLRVPRIEVAHVIARATQQVDADRPEAHPNLGNLALEGPIGIASGMPAPLVTPAPMLGEHTAEVLGGLLGLSADELGRMGFRIAIYPGLGRYAAGYAIRETLDVLKRDGSTKAARDWMLTFREYNEALGLPEVEEWEHRFMQTKK